MFSVELDNLSLFSPNEQYRIVNDSLKYQHVFVCEIPKAAHPGGAPNPKYYVSEAISKQCRYKIFLEHHQEWH
jgi:hypothetical protein